MKVQHLFTKELLEELYLHKKLSGPEIARQLGVKHSAVHTYLNKFNITRKSDPSRKLIDKDKLYNLYVLQKKSKEELEAEFKCCRQTLNRALKKYGFISKYMNYTDFEIIDMYLNQLLSLTQISVKTKIPKSQIRQILLKNSIQLRDKSSCQCINLDNKNELIQFDFNILKSQSILKRKLQSFFKNRISKNIKNKRGNKCEICGSTSNLHAHHLKPLSIILSQIIKENPDKNDHELYQIITHNKRYLDETNLLVVCTKCHYTKFHPYIHYHVNQ